MDSHQSDLAQLGRNALLALALLLPLAPCFGAEVTSTTSSPSAWSQKYLSLPKTAGFTLGAPALLTLHVGILPRPDVEVFFAGGGIALPLSTFTVAEWHFDAGVRYFHRGQHFYFGLNTRVMSVALDGKSFLVQTDTADGETPDIRLGGLYLVPNIGLQFRVRKNLTLSFEVGIQFALAVFGDIHSSRNGEPWGKAPSTLYSGLSDSSQRPLQYIAKTPLPSISLFRLSWDI